MNLPASAEDSIDAFVSDLRVLWKDTGQVTFEAIARRVGPSKSSLNEAVTRRDRIPSDTVVAELVGFLAPEQVNHWLRRRAALEEQLRRSREAPRPVPALVLEPDGEIGPPGPPGAAPWWRTLPMVVGAAALASGLLLGFGLGRATAPGDTATRPQLSDGSDPIAAGCIPDANAVAAKTVAGVGTLKLLYSSRCNAFWAKLVRLDGHQAGNKLDVAVYQVSAPARAQRAVDTGVSDSYSFVLVRADPSEAICATGTVWTGDKPHAIPGPVC